jgi:hypothetical protein
MAKSTLARHYCNVTPLAWLDEQHFVGTVDWKPTYSQWEERTQRYIAVRREDLDTTLACYGWTKGGNFFVYTISDGHIENLGSVPREELVDG